MTANPFHALYVTEHLAPDEFVKIFSPAIVAELRPLYRPGNIVLRGMQGSGKSMLLSLLKPELRVAYERLGEPFPIAEEAPFIGCGINLLRSRAFEFGQRASVTLAKDSIDTGILFGDLLNFYLTADLLKSVSILRDGGSEIRDSMGITPDPEALDAFAEALSAAECWFGYLDDVRTYAALVEALERRVSLIRSFVNRNRDELPPDLTETRTSAGEPLSETVSKLRSTGIVGKNVEMFVRIDQYEELHYLRERAGTPVAPAVDAMQGAIHKMMGVRDARLSYRIGARRFAWPDAPERLGGAPLERLRDYDFVDLDDALSQKENSQRSYFHFFARDIFVRRVQQAGYATKTKNEREIFRALVGATPPKADKARAQVGETPSALLPGADEFDQAIRARLSQIAAQDPLSGALAVAWVRSKSARGDVAVAEMAKEPWLGYWKRDRQDQAILQLAATATQRMRWWGDEDVLRLSDGNPLAFVSICKEMFAAAERNRLDIQAVLLGDCPPLAPAVQAEAIYQASEAWYLKLAEREHGRSIQAMCTRLGTWARMALRADRTMSRPGHNGISIDELELLEDESLAYWFRECVDVGALVSSRHTSRSGGTRVKFYLPPILGPRFQVPISRRKEPLYLAAASAKDWLQHGGSPPSQKSPGRYRRLLKASAGGAKSGPTDQPVPTLFD